MADDSKTGPLGGGSNLDKFKALTQLRHAKQAKWFINAYWSRDPVNLEKNPDDAEHIFQAFNTMSELCEEGRKGSDLDQWKSHQFLEKMKSTVTWDSFKKVFGEMDFDFNNRLSLIEYLFFWKRDDGVTVKSLVNAPQKILPGLAEAEAALDAAQSAHEEQMKQQEAATSLQQQIREFKERFDKISAKFQAKIDDESLSAVKRNKAKAELGAHLSGARARRKKITELDPDKLHKMEIDQGAAVRKQKAATKLLKKQLARAKELVEKIKSAGQAGGGLIWWLDRELAEEEKYMSQKAFAKKKAKLEKKKAKLLAGDAAK